MKWKPLIFIALLGLLASCSVVQVSSDYDETANFSQYKSFAFYKSGIKKLKINDLSKKHILYRIREGLEAQGMHYAKKPDLYVNVRLHTRKEVGVETVYYPYSWSGWWAYPWGWGLSWGQTRSYSYRVGFLYVDFIDAKTQKLVWEGRSIHEAPSDLSERAAYFRRSIAGILSQYPPRKE